MEKVEADGGGKFILDFILDRAVLYIRQSCKAKRDYL